jgi:hypothetical protein
MDPNASVHIVGHATHFDLTQMIDQVIVKKEKDRSNLLKKQDNMLKKTR